MDAKQPSAQNHNIQALRAIAAIGVVFHHMVDSLNHHLAPGQYGWNPAIGSYGVDLFFVISGYVMMMVSSRRSQTPAQFVRDRIFRIVPLYWLLTLVACIPLILGFQIFGNDGLSALHLLRSLFFIPPTEGGDMGLPILFVGWTLNFEMMFYLLFALAIGFVRPGRRAAALAAAILGLITLAMVTGWEPLQFIGSPITLGFALGAVLWEIVARLTITARVATALMAAGMAGFVMLDIAGVGGLDRTRAGVSIAAALIVWGAIAWERCGLTAGRGALSLLGDASYSLYLTHPFVLQFAGKAAVVSALNQSVAGLTVTLVAMAVGSIATGIVVHLWIERPLLLATKGRMARKPVSPTGLA